MNRFNIPDIDLLDKSPDTILAEMLQHIVESTGLELQRADPRRKMLEGLAAFVSFERNRHERAIKQFFLAYAEDNSLDMKGLELKTPRLPAVPAKTVVEYEFEPDRDIPIPIFQGSKIRIADEIFVVTETVIVPVGENYASVKVEAEVPGSQANGYVANEPTTLVEPQSYVITVRNTITTAGGKDIEDNDAYAERIRLAPETFSVAGPTLAYKAYALSASQDIIDVHVDTPSPGSGITRIVPLMKNGELPTQDDLDTVLAVCSDEAIRPLTDNVIAEAPNVYSFDMAVEYWLPVSKNTVAAELVSRIDEAFAEYLIWQRSKLGRAINPTEVINRLKHLDDNTLGAARVEVDTTYTTIDKDEIAVANVTSCTFMGFIDE